MRTCNCCGSGSLLLLYKLSKRNIMRCRDCNLIFADHSNISSANYYDNKYSEKILNDFRMDMSHEAYAERMLNKIMKFKKTGKILDIGSGSGHFLYVAARNNWQSLGVEFCEDNFKYAKEVLGLDVINADAEKLELEDSSFDVVTMWDVIEHMKDPTAVLKKAHSLLNSNGLLCLETPNASSAYHRVLGRKWASFEEYSHLYFFKLDSLKMLLEKTGFKIVNIETDNVNFFSFEGLRRFRLHGHFYNFKLIFKKTCGYLPVSFVLKKSESKQKYHKKYLLFKAEFVKFLNYPTNLLLNHFLLGDQLRIIARKC